MARRSDFISAIAEGDPRRDVLCPGEREGHRVAWGAHGVQEPERQRRLGRDSLRSKEKPRGARRAYEGHEPPHRPPGGGHPQPNLLEGVSRRGVPVGEIAGDGELRPSAEGRPGDGREHRNAQPFESSAQARAGGSELSRLFGAVLPAKLAEVAAGDETPPRAGHDDGAERRVSSGVVDRLDEGAHRDGVERVLRLRAGERPDDRRPDPLDSNHGLTPVARRRSAASRAAEPGL